ncbi:MAG: aromatic-ring-hydroxylating dioxygenase subunit beta [Pseudomonadota bacterium]
MTKHNNEREVTREVRDEIERFLFREARLIDSEQEREWLETMVDTEITYQVFSRQLRYRKDTRGSGDKEVYFFDDNYADLAHRVELCETGMQWVADPPNRLRRIVGNIEGFEGERAGEYRVYSNCMVTRNRMVYEQMSYAYGREDILRRGVDGRLKLLQRVVDFEERFVRGKNLLFIL